MTVKPSENRASRGLLLNAKMVVDPWVGEWVGEWVKKYKIKTLLVLSAQGNTRSGWPIGQINLRTLFYLPQRGYSAVQVLDDAVASPLRYRVLSSWPMSATTLYVLYIRTKYDSICHSVRI